MNSLRKLEAVINPRWEVRNDVLSGTPIVVFHHPQHGELCFAIPIEEFKKFIAFSQDVLQASMDVKKETPN